jgi:dTDP-4-amino-4,6-dideoxygalactose transaminase
MLTTANPEYDRKFRLWRQHGMSVTDAVRHGSSQVIFESYPELGYNYRMTDMQAAVGREQLKRLPAIVARRRELAGQYAEQLDAAADIALPFEPKWARSNWQSFCVGLLPHLDQRKVMQELLDRGISTRRGIMNIHVEKAYADGASHRIPGSLERSLAAQQHAIILPLFVQMRDSELTWVADAVKATVPVSLPRIERVG